MNLMRITAAACLLALSSGQAWPQAPKKDETPEVQAARKHLADLESQLKAMRAEAAQLKADIEKNDVKLQQATAAAKLPFVKNSGRRALAENRLTLVRAALQLYYADTGGRYPASLAELCPAYLKALPELDLPGYSKTNNSVTVKKLKGQDISGAVTNKGGWLYVADAVSALYGSVYIDAKAAYKGKPFFKY